MKFILKIKAWQLFMLMWGAPWIISLFTFANESSLGFTIMMIFFAGSLLLWFYSLGIELAKIIPTGISINQRGFQFHIWYMIVLIIVGGLLTEHKEFIESGISIFVLAVLYYFVAVFIVIRYISKVIASIELKKLATAADYTGYFMLLYFSPVGIWIIQPKIQKMLN